jgi:hypothetical protein
VVAALALTFLPSLIEHARHAANPLVYNDDARQQIWPFLRYRDPALFRDDYLADYQLAINPVGFTAIYRTAAVVTDPRTLSRALPYVLLLVTIVCLGWTAWRLGGPAVACATAALCLSSDIFLIQMGGGLPRALGVPVVAMVALSLVASAPLGLAAATVLGSALYFPVGVLAGLVLAAFLLLPPRWTGGPTWSLGRRASIIAATALVSAGVMLPTAIAMRPYGPTVGPSDWTRYPEASLAGRLGEADVVYRRPLRDVLDSIGETARRTLHSYSEPWHRAVRDFGERHSAKIHGLIAVALLVGYVRVARDDGAARRLGLLPIGAGVAWMAAWFLVPHLYLPSRYIRSAVPVALVVMLPVALAGLTRLFRHDGGERRWSGFAAIVGSAALIVLLGGRGSSDAGLTVQLQPDRQRLLNYVASLSPDAIVAGWPDTPSAWPQREPTISDVPYFTGRRILMSREVHLPFHQAYLDEMRMRMTALMAAYFATDVRPLIHLRDRFGVTHLLIDVRHYAVRPGYFMPFEVELQALAAQVDAGAEIRRQAGHAAVFRDGDYVLLDLGLVR